MFDLSTLFKPLMSTPNASPEKYVEIQPCDALKPYINCFWGTPKPYTNKFTVPPTVVIPDACMDIIFHINYSTDESTSMFIGIQDGFFLSGLGHEIGMISTFGIRFYFWAVHLFVENELHDVSNVTIDVEQYFPNFKKSLENTFIYHPRIENRIPHVEHYLLNKLHYRLRENKDVLNAVSCILKAKGVISIPKVCDYVCISQRQLERVFSKYIGMAPKKVIDLVRYQNVWRDVFLGETSDLRDIVYDYGYSDQPHLLKDFKKHHGMTPKEAFNFAWK